MQVAGTGPSSAENQNQDVRSAGIKSNERAVEKVKVAIQSFLNLFHMKTKDLVILSSGATASSDVTTDVLKAEKSVLKPRQNLFPSVLN